MIKSIKNSISKKTFVSIMGLLVVCCIIIYGVVLYFLPKNYQTELQSQFISEFYQLVEIIEENGFENTVQTITSFCIKNNSTVSITDRSGKILMQINAINETENTTSSGKAISASADFSYGNTTYTMMASASFVAVTQSYLVLLNLIPLIAVIMILISVIGAYVCSRYFSKPLVHICSVAKRMSQLDMTWKCDTSRSDEIGILATSLNEMSEQLSDALQSLKIANEQLQEDIEKERQQEKQRVDFFTSVSHELKTPITIIKGQLEGMIYQVGEYSDRDTYLRHSLKTIDVMEKLVKEILSAARMNGSDFQITPTDVNISNMLFQCCRKMQGIAEDKQVDFRMEIQPDFHYQGDEQLLQKAFSNIVGNAVSYTPDNGSIIVILKDGVLRVENTGTHISDEDLEQIFTPFFRVDKSHNRNTGGSGLGLYIVKSIFDLHRIQYNLENTEQGVRFSVDFS